MNKMRIQIFGTVLALLLSVPVWARVLAVKPSSKHQKLTLTTDESSGFRVVQGKHLKLRLIGPGMLTVSVRLNHRAKRSIFNGRLEVQRAGKRIKRSRLKLHRSRVGAYRELPGLNPSLPKVFRLKTPEGVQNYVFSLRGGRGTSMTLHLSYDTQVKQGPASASDPLALVSLVPDEEAREKEMAMAVIPPPPGKTMPEVEEPPPAKEEPPVLAVIEPPKLKAHETAAALKKLPTAKAPKVVKRKKPKTVIKQAPKAKAKAKAQAKARPKPSASLPLFSIGIKGGQVSPVEQKIGGTTVTGSVDLRFILPLAEGRLSIGVEAGYYRYQMAVTRDYRENWLQILPLSLQIFYRFPSHTMFEPYLGLGGDVFLTQGKAIFTDRPDSENIIYDGRKMLYGAHLIAGLEGQFGPGFLMIEARYGKSFGDSGAWENNPSIAGITTVAGYRFVF